jgi:hypothetical protein
MGGEERISQLVLVFPRARALFPHHDEFSTASGAVDDRDPRMMATPLASPRRRAPT